MQELILDSTWSYRLRTLVYLRHRDNPIVCYPSQMEKFTESKIKEDYRTAREYYSKCLTEGIPDMAIGSQIINTEEVQSIIVKVDLINENGRGKGHNDYAAILADNLATWYAHGCQDDENI